MYATATILGRLTADWESRTVGQQNTLIASTSVAVNHKKDDDGHFFDVQVWGKAAEILAQYTKKGDPIFMVCRVEQDRWQTKEGQNRSRVMFTVQDFKFISQRDSQQNNNQRQGTRQQDEDNPFG